MSESDKSSRSPTPKEFDESAAERVEKKPKEKESPQQTHDDETHG
ncbi:MULTISPECIES: hypothetical protein [Rhodanobacteraceae]|jgi:hypothetical protein|nr:MULTISPECIES: hypothetical protein [Rhodanobacteraceae]SDF51176.1 hypothetical protein SAMN04515659_1128 [Dyella sp. 333MFSha]SKB25266.1 hypothetical protein SAMN05660880_00022 [Luteibacter sp. 22Crub2.1]